MIELRRGVWRFTFRPGLALLALAVFVAMIMLGNWQARRAEQKIALQQRVDERAQGPVLSLPPTPVALADYEHARVAVRGEFANQHTVFVDNRVLRGHPGYDVVTPLRIRGGDMHVLVNRGWIAIGPTRERLPQVPTPSGELVIEGLAVNPPEHVYELAGTSAAGPLMQHLVLARMRERTGLKLQPLVLLQTTEIPDGLARVRERPDVRVNTHRAYALQWYVMGALVLILYFTLNLKRGNGSG